VSSIINEISSVVLAGDCPKLGQKEIAHINQWLKNKFGARFQCQNRKEANRLIKNISAWTRQHQRDLQAYIDSGIWQNQQMDALNFQRKVLAHELDRNLLKKKADNIKKLGVTQLDSQAPDFIETWLMRRTSAFS